jgi:hypothetical protein
LTTSCARRTIVQVVTITRLLFVVALVSTLASLSASTARSGLPSGPVGRVVLVAITGKGGVSSAPHGIACPKKCRAFFVKDELVKLVAHPASGWKLGRWSGSCAGRRSACSFNLTTSHDCSGGLCRVGAFGVRVSFVRLGTDQ